MLVPLQEVERPNHVEAAIGITHVEFDLVRGAEQMTHRRHAASHHMANLRADRTLAEVGGPRDLETTEVGQPRVSGRLRIELVRQRIAAVDTQLRRK